MNGFDIVQIGAEAAPTDGIPDGCEICGHCTVMRRMLPPGAPLPCGAVPAPPAPPKAAPARREPARDARPASPRH